jgi:putative salt-induced outer membrane protein YdiY
MKSRMELEAAAANAPRRREAAESCFSASSAIYCSPVLQPGARKAGRYHVIVGVLTLMLAGTWAAVAAEPVSSPQPVYVTNYVVVTNVLVVTNYVTLTNAGNQFPTPNSQLPTNSSLSALTWLPPEDGFDWIEIKSGEWLKGKIKSMQDEKLEFDSEELDDRVFDWEDIRTVRSPRLNSVRFDKAGKADGALLVTTNEVRVVSQTATNIHPRADLLGIAPTGNREWNKWSGQVAAGLSFRSGNTKEVEYNAHLTLNRRTPSTLLTFDYLGNFGKINGVETENNQRLQARFDSYLSRRLFLRAPDVEYYHDPLQNLEHRYTLGAGMGYKLVKTRRVDWEITAGPAYQRNEFSSVGPGESNTRDSLAMVFGSRLEIELSKRLDFILEYRAQFSGRETGNNTHHGVATLKFDIHKRLKLDLSLIWDSVASPTTESSGLTPQKDDVRLMMQVGLDF